MITKRLEKIVSSVSQCKVLADVGCDHGYIGLETLKRGVADRVVFIDVSAPSLQKARRNCQNIFENRAKFVCQDGIGDVVCDCAVIAGMGGLETISVLNSTKVLPQKLVLQPMRNQQDVRIWLTAKYKILSDCKFFDGKFYDLIVAEKSDGGSVLTADEILFGKSNLENPSQDFVQFLQREKEKYNKILQQCNEAEIVEKHNTVCRILAGILEEQT